jgi:NAD(P)-dependent dehydrogenase (short-subunit alcohol dehydrogenase family)
MDLELKEKVAIVTGAGGGIGREIALTLAREGARVVIADVDESTSGSVQKEIEELGGQALACTTDVSSKESVRGMTAKAFEKYQKVDILVNNAAAFGGKLFIDDEEENWEKVVKVCLFGVLHCSRAVIDHMIERKYGKIINISSDAGKVGESRMAVYAAAKAGIIGFTKSLALEVGRHGINVNVVAPSMTLSAKVKARIDDERMAKILKFYPLKRLGEPEDIARMVTFLASDAASWVTGQAISVNGGFCMA